MTPTITPQPIQQNPPQQFSIKGKYEAKRYSNNWVVQWTPTPNPYCYRPPSIIAHCENEAQAKTIKRALQNALNTQKRKHQQQ